MTKLRGTIAIAALVLVPLTAHAAGPGQSTSAAERLWNELTDSVDKGIQPSIDYLALPQCLDAAVDALSSQPDPAETIASAVFGSCEAELTEMALFGSLSGSPDPDPDPDKLVAVYKPGVLARILANRAARAALQKQPSRKPSHAILEQ